MSDLFELPESPLPPLEAARRRLWSYQAEYDKQRRENGVVSQQAAHDLYYAELEVERLEWEAVRK